MLYKKILKRKESQEVYNSIYGEFFWLPIFSDFNWEWSCSFNQVLVLVRLALEGTALATDPTGYYFTKEHHSIWRLFYQPRKELMSLGDSDIPWAPKVLQENLYRHFSFHVKSNGMSRFREWSTYNAAMLSCIGELALRGIPLDRKHFTSTDVKIWHLFREASEKEMLRKRQE